YEPLLKNFGTFYVYYPPVKKPIEEEGGEEEDITLQEGDKDAKEMTFLVPIMKSKDQNCNIIVIKWDPYKTVDQNIDEAVYYFLLTETGNVTKLSRLPYQIRSERRIVEEVVDLTMGGEKGKQKKSDPTSSLFKSFSLFKSSPGKSELSKEDEEKLIRDAYMLILHAKGAKIEPLTEKMAHARAKKSNKEGREIKIMLQDLAWHHKDNYLRSILKLV
ncbi:MAG: hypothetical protein ACTSUE_13065, partial [Promethearchaeota archaeon]